MIDLSHSAHPAESAALYLSRLLLNRRSNAVRRDLADCQLLHRAILATFPQAPAGASGARDHFGVLYRVENPTRADGALALLVQSNTEPQWSRLDRTYLAPPSGDLPNPAIRRVDVLYSAIASGATLTFRLRANPTRRLNTPIGPDGQRVPGKRVELRDDEQRLAWLQRKGEQHGFTLLAVRANPAVPDVRATQGDKLTGRRRPVGPALGAEAGGTMTFGSVLFEGLLRVTDTGAFGRALADGIGSGKAYGFGLLSVARPRE